MQVNNTLPAGPAVHGHLLIVHLALVLPPLAFPAQLPLPPHAVLLEGVQLLGDLLHPPAVDQLVDVQGGPGEAAGALDWSIFTAQYLQSALYTLH